MQLGLRPPITAGVALAGASLIAVTPVAPPLPDIQVSAPAVQLSAATSPFDLLDPLAALAGTGGAGGSVITDITSAADGLLGGILNPGGELSSLGGLLSGLDLGALLNLSDLPGPFPLITPTQLITDTLANLTSLGQTFLAEPFPVLQAIIPNLIGYVEQLAGAVQGSATALVSLLEELPTTLQTAFGFLASGDVFDAGQTLLTYVLEGPLFAVLPLLEGIGPIITSIFGNLDSVAGVFAEELGPIAVITIGALYGPGEAANGALAVAQNIVDALGTADFAAVLQNIVLAPSTILGAFLNGYPEGIFSPLGFLTSPSFGTISNILIARDDIASAIMPFTPTDPAGLAALDPALAADPGGLFGGLPADLGGVLGAVPADLGTLAADLLTIF